MKLIFSILLWVGATIIFNVVMIITLPFNIVYYSITGELADYFYNLAIGEDQRAGSYLYKTEDFTISAYSFYLGVVKENKYAYLFMKFIDFFPMAFGIENHCRNAYFSELKKAQKRK